MPAAQRKTPSDQAAAGPQQQDKSTSMRLVVAALSGVLATVVTGLVAGWSFAALVGWDVTAIVIVVWTALAIVPMDAAATAAHAVREDPARALTDLLLVVASVASLVGTAFVIVAAGKDHGWREASLVVLAIVTVASSWAVVHTTFTLRYARLFFVGKRGGINFNEDDGSTPQYTDFLYMAVTIGMTFQVSDTNITTKVMRATALRHALLSYLFGVVIIAVMINFVAGLTN